MLYGVNQIKHTHNDKIERKQNKKQTKKEYKGNILTKLKLKTY